MQDELKNVKREKAIYYATGKRKTSIACVWLTAGNGKITFNKKELVDVRVHTSIKDSISKPLHLTNTADKYDIRAQVIGGGVRGQAEAVMYGIAKALNTISEEYHRILKSEGLLTRDARIVERKKYFRKKARKRTQYRKR